MDGDRERLAEAGHVFLGHGGEMGALIRSHDWATTALGPAEFWPRSLKTVVDIVISSPLAMVVLWGSELTQIYNSGFAEIAGGRHPGALGQPNRACWPEVWSFNRPIVEAVWRGEVRWFSRQPLVLLRNGVEETGWFDLGYSPIADDDGSIGGVLVTVAERTGHVRAAMAAEAVLNAAQRLQAMFEHAPGFVAILSGPEHRFEFASEGYRRLVGVRDLVGLNVRAALPEIEGQGAFEQLDEVYATGRPHVGIATPVSLLRDPAGEPEAAWVDFVFEPITGADGAVIGVFISGSDVTARVSAEEHQKLLNAELQHRVKNVLAVVQSIASVASRSETSVAAFSTSLAGRIQAVAKTQDLLIEGIARPVEMCRLLTNELAPYLGDQLTFECESLVVPPSSATNLALLVHELLTNAAKYGGLASGEGRLDVRCIRDGDHALLLWTETLAAPPAPQGPAGFGSQLIRRLARSIGPGARIEFLPTGLTARIPITLQDPASPSA